MIVSRSDAKTLFTINDGRIDAVYLVRDAKCVPDRAHVMSIYDGCEHFIVDFPTKAEAIFALDQIQAHFQKKPMSAIRNIAGRILVDPTGSILSSLICIGNHAWGVLRSGEIHVVYTVSPSRTTSGWWDITWIEDQSRKVLATAPDRSAILEQFDILISDLHRSLGDHNTHQKASAFGSIFASIKNSVRKSFAVPALACLGAFALYGAGHLLTRPDSHPTTGSSPTLPPSIFQDMMTDQNDEAGNAIQMLRQKIDSAQVRRAPVAKAEGVKDGYSVSPSVPIAIPGMEIPAQASSRPPDRASQSISVPAATPDDADIESMQKRLSILSGVDNTAPLPGSDIGNYRDMEKVLPDVSAGHH